MNDVTDKDHTRDHQVPTCCGRARASDTPTSTTPIVGKRLWLTCSNTKLHEDRDAAHLWDMLSAAREVRTTLQGCL